MTTPKIYEFYFPKTKSKHIAKPVKGKVYPSKGGTVRYGIQATMNGSMSLPKYIKEEEFNRLGFGAEEKKNCGCGQDPCITYGAETYDAEIEGNVEYERMEERTVDVLQEIEQPFSVQTDPAEYEHEYPEDIENAIKQGIHKQLYDNPDSKLAREGGFIENIETDVEVVDLEDDPVGEPRELTAYGNLGKPEVNEEEEYGREAKTNFIDEEFRNEGVYEATSGSGQISHNPIDVVKQRPAIMRHDYAFTHYDWNTGNYDLTDEQEDELDERIREEITSKPSEGHMDFEIDDVAEDDDGDFITANVDAYTNYGEGRFYGFDAESKMNNCPVCKGDTHADMSMIGEETVADICGDCDIYIMPQENDYPRVSCIECGFGDPYGSANTCMNCDAIKNEMEFINMGAETVGNPSPSSPLEETPASVPSPAEPTNENFSAEGEIVYSVHYTTPNGDKIKHNEYYLDDYGGSEESIINEIEYETNWFDSAWETATITKGKVGSQEKEVIKTLTYESETFESQNSNMKLALGLSALGIGLAFWKGKEVMSLWDSITSRLKK